jgi:AAA ATPase domain
MVFTDGLDFAVGDPLPMVEGVVLLGLGTVDQAGVGKTRLVAEFAGRARAAGARVLAGGCVRLGEDALPYVPFSEALRGLVRSLDPAALDALVGEGRAELARLVPDLGAAGPASQLGRGGEWTQARLFALVLGLLERLAATAPLVLVVEDLHWADGPACSCCRYWCTACSRRAWLVGDVDHDVGDVVAGVGQDQNPEGPLGAHPYREGGDVLKAAGEPHLTQRGPATGQVLSKLPGLAPSLVAGVAEVRRLDGHLQGGAPGHADRLVGRVGMHQRDIAHQVPHAAEPVDVEHHPVAGVVGGGTDVVDLGGDGVGGHLLGAGAPGQGAAADGISGVGPLGSRCRL